MGVLGLSLVEADRVDNSLLITSWRTSNIYMDMDMVMLCFTQIINFAEVFMGFRIVLVPEFNVKILNKQLLKFINSPSTFETRKSDQLDFTQFY